MEYGNKYRIVIGDERVLFRRGLKALLSTEPDLSVAADVGSVAELIAQSDRHTVDLILLNEALEPDAPQQLPAPVLLMTQEPDTRENSVPVNSPPHEIVAAVRAYARQLRSRPGTREMVSAQPAASFGTLPGLTVRETEVARLFADNLTAREVAKELGLSVKTVEAHKLNVMRKLGVHNRTALIGFVLRHSSASVDLPATA